MSVEDPTDPLTSPCSVCDLAIGDHSVRDWYAHVQQGDGYHVPMEELPVTFDGGTLGDIVPSDTVNTRALIVDVPAMGRLGVIEMHFQQGNPVGANRSVHKVHFLGPPKTLRQAGTLIRDSFFRSANVAEGKP